MGRWIPRTLYDTLAGVIKPGTVINEIGAHEDMLTTLLAAAGNANVKEELLNR